MADGAEEEALRRRITEWFENLPVDGYVESVGYGNGQGRLIIDLFAHRLRDLNLQEGQFVRITVVTEERLDGVRL